MLLNIIIWDFTTNLDITRIVLSGQIDGPVWYMFICPLLPYVAKVGPL